MLTAKAAEPTAPAPAQIILSTPKYFLSLGCVSKILKYIGSVRSETDGVEKIDNLRYTGTAFLHHTNPH